MTKSFSLAGLTPRATCTVCKKRKPRDAFYKQESKLTGIRSWCKQCSKAKVKQWKAEHADPEIAARKQARALRRPYRDRYTDAVKTLIANHREEYDALMKI